MESISCLYAGRASSTGTTDATMPTTTAIEQCRRRASGGEGRDCQSEAAEAKPHRCDHFGRLAGEQVDCIDGRLHGGAGHHGGGRHVRHVHALHGVLHRHRGDAGKAGQQRCGRTRIRKRTEGNGQPEEGSEEKNATASLRSLYHNISTVMCNAFFRRWGVNCCARHRPVFTLVSEPSRARSACRPHQSMPWLTWAFLPTTRPEISSA